MSHGTCPQTGVAPRIATLAAACLLALGAAPASPPEPLPSAGQDAGAHLPFDQYEAEDARWTGTLVGPDRRQGTLASEASGRQAILLSRPGDHVVVRLRHAADAITVRAAVPDAPDGRGRDGVLTMLVDGREAGRLPVTSRYGWYYGRYPFTNDPLDGAAHHFFDETRRLLPRRLPAGSRIELRFDAAAGVPWIAVDLVDLEPVRPAATVPAGALSIIDFGGDPTGGRSSADALERAIAAAREAGVAVWLPPGTYRVDRHVIVDRVRLLGAGPWRTVLRGAGVGLYGRNAPHGSTAVELAGFSIIGEVTDRHDDEQSNAIGGAMGGGTWLHDLFIQHTKAGLWFDGPMDGIRISRLRVTDTAADGLNFHRGVSHAVVEESFFRNNGDDGLAAWSETVADHDILFVHNTVVLPMLANGIAFYGGHDLAAEDDLVVDVVTGGGGLHLGNRFNAVAASGPIRFARDVVIRAGGRDPRWTFGVGALWFYALDHPIAAQVSVDGVVLSDSGAAAIQFLGQPIAAVTFKHLHIRGAAGPALQTQSDGSALVLSAALEGAGRPSWRACTSGFTLRPGRTEFGRPSSRGCPKS